MAREDSCFLNDDPGASHVSITRETPEAGGFIKKSLSTPPSDRPEVQEWLHLLGSDKDLMADRIVAGTHEEGVTGKAGVQRWRQGLTD